MAVSATNAVSGAQGQQNTTGTDPYASLKPEQFMKILITEMQNQDPMEPMKNSDIVNQVSQISAIQTNQKLSTALDSVMLGQNMATAASMIGKTISALDDNAKEVTGKVDKVVVEKGEPKLYIGDQKVSVKNIRELLPSS